MRVSPRGLARQRQHGPPRRLLLPLILPLALVGALGDGYGTKWLAEMGLAIAILLSRVYMIRRGEQHGADDHAVLAACGDRRAIGPVFGLLVAEITWSIVEEGDGNGGDEENKSMAPYMQVHELCNVAFWGDAMAGPIMVGVCTSTKWHLTKAIPEAPVGYHMSFFPQFIG